MTRKPLTERDVSPPYAVCDTCGSVPALHAEHGPECVSCMTRRALIAEARTHLETLLLPILGAWAAHWRTAGLDGSALATPFESYLDHLPEHRDRAGYLEHLARRSAPPAYVPAEPDRLTLALEGLPVLTAWEPGPSGTARGARFTASPPEGGPLIKWQAGPAHDTLTLELPGGDAVFIPFGMDGRTRPQVLREAVRVPAHLREQVREAYTPYTSAEASA